VSRFICIEGLRAVGKSTVASQLAAQLGATLIETVPREFDSARRSVNARTNVNARFCFFMCAVFVASDEIKQALDSGTDVVVESYFFRTIAFHKGMGASVDIGIPITAPKPTHAFLLKCEQSLREKRLAGRDKPAKTWDVLAEAHTTAIAARYGEFGLVEIDTTELTIDETCRRIVRMILDRHR
jgi:thymidylate kinase